jgi:hypothetical protein
MPKVRHVAAVVVTLGATTGWAQVDDQPNLRVAAPTSAQAEAQRHLKEGQALMSEDAFMEAAKQFEAAVAQDPGLFMPRSRRRGRRSRPAPKRTSASSCRGSRRARRGSACSGTPARTRRTVA